MESKKGRMPVNDDDAAMVTYVGGLRSPPVSQSTAIHQDIQGGSVEGTGWESLRGWSLQAIGTSAGSSWYR